MMRLITCAGVLSILGLAGSGWADASDTGAGLKWCASTQNPPSVTHVDDPSQPVAFAASELRRYLGQILDVDLAGTRTGVGCPTIQVSVSSDMDLTDEGYELKADGDTFSITGGGDPGVVYGVYEFLRRYGGCRFSDLGPDGEYVPRAPRIEAKAEPIRMKPKLWYRGLQFSRFEDIELTRRRIDWMAKNGLNYLIYKPVPPRDDKSDRALLTDPPAQARQLIGKHFTKAHFDQLFRPEVRKRGLKLDMNHHNLLYWLPPSRYLSEHPEYYSLIDGKRGKKLTQLCICTSNPDAVQIVIENVRRYIRENPEVKIVGVIPEDGYGMCQCAKCVAQDLDPRAAWKHGGQRNDSKSRRYVKLVNAVAHAIRDEFPDVLIGGAAYVDLAWPPTDIEIAPNTVFWVALYWRDSCRPMAPEHTSERNREFYEILQEWKRVYRGRLIVYEYYMGMNAQCSLPYPISETLCQDWDFLKALGIGGATIQCWSSNHSTYALNNLAFARCGWYDHVDHTRVLDDYLLGAYGSVAEEIRPIFDALLRVTRCYARRTEDLLPQGRDNIRHIFSDELRRITGEALESARHKADNDHERRQIDRLSAAARYWEMAANISALRWQAYYIREANPKVALALLDQVVHELWPTLQEYAKTSIPPGWLAVTTPRKLDQWMRQDEALRNEIAGQVSK